MGQLNRITSIAMSHERASVVLAIVSCTGVVATAVMAARAAPKASRIIEDLREPDEEGRSRDHIPAKEVIKHTWKVYAPAIGAGVITISSIILMNRVSERNAAILTAGAALATNTLKDYQHHVLEELGAEKESKIRDKMAKRAVSRADIFEDANFVLSDASKTIVYDTLTGRTFESDIETIRRIENDLNREILSSMYVSLNDVYDALGLETVEVGDILGFNTDNMIDFHYSPQFTNQRKPVVALGYLNLPVVKYRNL